jgi:hypothetical protein
MEKSGLLFYNDLIDFFTYPKKIYSTYYFNLKSTNLLVEVGEVRIKDEYIYIYIYNLPQGPSFDQIKIDEKVLPHKAYLF